MPGERGYSLNQRAVVMQNRIASGTYEESVSAETVSVAEEELVGAAVGAGGNGHSTARRAGQYATKTARTLSYGNTGNGSGAHDGTTPHHLSKAEQAEADMALETTEDDEPLPRSKRHAIFSKEMLHEVLLNPGIYLLFAGITIGFFSRLQGSSVTDVDDALFVTLFQGVLCLFLLEMGMTASQKLKDLASGGWQFILYGLLAPNLFATTGILVAHGYSLFLGQPFEIGTYVLFAVLCGAASYIAVPAVQRLAIPEASPTLPLAASLGLTFSYNVTIGIPVYILIAKLITSAMPIYV
jgi:hypothetical protein